MMLRYLLPSVVDISETEKKNRTVNINQKRLQPKNNADTFVTFCSGYLWNGIKWTVVINQKRLRNKNKAKY